MGQRKKSKQVFKIRHIQIDELPINFVNMFFKLFSDSCTYLLNILQNMILETMVFYSKVRFVVLRWVDPINLCKLQIIFSSKTMFSNQNDYTRSVL